LWLEGNPCLVGVNSPLGVNEFGQRLAAQTKRSGMSACRQNRVVPAGVGARDHARGGVHPRGGGERVRCECCCPRVGGQAVQGGLTVCAPTPSAASGDIHVLSRPRSFRRSACAAVRETDPSPSACHVARGNHSQCGWRGLTVTSNGAFRSGGRRHGELALGRRRFRNCEYR